MYHVKHSLLRFTSSFCRWLTRHSARILMYHRFAPDSVNRKLWAAIFEQQVRYLVRHYKPCRMDQLVARLQTGGPLPVNLVAITVDDGYADFVELAYPILKRYNVPATVYVVTKFIDQGMWLWFDVIRYQVGRAKPGAYVLEIAGGDAYHIVLDEGRSRSSAWHTLADACLPLTQSERMTALSQIGGALEVPLPSRPTSEFRGMTWDDLRKLDPELIEVGSHTCSHPILSRCSGDELEEELVESKTTIERELGCEVTSFCYPNGQPGDYDARVVAAVQAAGYTNAVIGHGTLVGGDTNRFALERMGTPSNDTAFRNAVDGYPHLLRQARIRIGALSWW